MTYIDDVGTGFTEQARRDLGERLEPLARSDHPFAVVPPREDVTRARWCSRCWWGEVVYRQFTRGVGRLVHTAWRGLREDRDRSDVLVPQPSDRTTDPAPPAVTGRPSVRSCRPAAARSPCPNWTNPSTPPGLPRRKCWTTTSGSRRSCCRTWPAVRSP
ncbi:hypothetical protein ACFFS4_38700 [Kutzneria kofuensis]|uniref:ATP dependent DNA ligase n=1 Tax=Kutzneria kofuensis TaxID=103725 RepID=UPI001FEBCB9C